ncbi:MAG: hypothetical protein RL217_1069 [Pseudomonadota bacterium]|jgi:hypothetical protein
MKSLRLVMFLAAMLSGAWVWAESPSATLYKDPSCGCCGAYADYLEENGFKVQRIDSTQMSAIKEKLGTSQAASCHTVKIGDYVVEGHVPVAAINKMLADKPAIHGLALPGMPMNSPGMGPEKKGSLEVLSLDKDGKVIGLYQRL